MAENVDNEKRVTVVSGTQRLKDRFDKVYAIRQKQEASFVSRPRFLEELLEDYEKGQSITDNKV